METIQKGKQTNKQTNKQAGVAHVEVWMQGVVQSCITCRVQYAMCQSMWKSFGDAWEMHWKSVEFDMQGHTLTVASFLQAVAWQFGAANISSSSNTNPAHMTSSLVA